MYFKINIQLAKCHFLYDISGKYKKKSRTSEIIDREK